MKFLVVGLGSMGKRRVRNLQAVGAAEVIGFDLREDRRKEACERYGIQTIDSWAAAKRTDVDAWVVSTPPLTHAAIALEALECGRHVFTEADLPDPLTKKVIEARDRLGYVAVPSCTMLHFPGSNLVRRLILDGAIGRPLLFTYHTGQHLDDWHPWEDSTSFYAGQRDTGAAREIVPFELVWLTKLFGPVNHTMGLHGRTGTLRAEIDDHYVLLLQFDCGVTGSLVVDALSRPEVRALRICGDNGVLEWNQADRVVRVRRDNESDWEVHALDRGSVESGYINPEEPYIAEICDFIAAIRGEKPFPHSFEEDEAVLKLLLDVEQKSLPRKVS